MKVFILGLLMPLSLIASEKCLIFEDVYQTPEEFFFRHAVDVNIGTNFFVVQPNQETYLNQFARAEMRKHKRTVVVALNKTIINKFPPNVLILQWPEIIPILISLEDNGLNVRTYSHLRNH